jgi:hypothetical protein
MSIIVQNSGVQANIVLHGQVLDIDFSDAAFVRCDTVLVDILQRTIGVMLHEGYHKIGSLPDAIRLDDIKNLKSARLSGQLGGSQSKLRLNAPIKLSNCA